MGLQRFPVGDFSGGLNNRDNPFELSPDEAQFCMSYTLTGRGLLKKRAGVSQFTTWPTAGAIIYQSLKAWYPNTGARYLFGSWRGGIDLIDTAGGATQKLVGAPDGSFCFEPMENSAGDDKLWCLNGSITPRKFDTAGLMSNWVATVGTVPKGTMLKSWKQRMIVAGVAASPQKIYWSEPNDPENWPANNFLIVSGSEDDLDPVTWIDVLGDTLLIFKTKSVWAINDPVSFAVRRIGTPGCEDRFQSGVIGNKCYFFNRNGIYATQGINVDLESELISPLFGAALDGDGPSYDIGGRYNIYRVLATSDRRLLVTGMYTGNIAYPNGDLTKWGMLELIPELRSRQRQQGRPYITSGPWLVHGPYATMGFSSLAEFQATAAGVNNLFGTINANSTYFGSALSKIFDKNTYTDTFRPNGNPAIQVNYAPSWYSTWRGIQEVEQEERIRRINLYIKGGPVAVEVFRDQDDISVLLPKFVGVSGGPYSQPKFVRFRPETRARYHLINIKGLVDANPLEIHRAEFSIRGGKEH